MKKTYALIPLMLASLLTACGGGSDSGAAPAAATDSTGSATATTSDTQATGNVGSVSANFVPSANARYILFSASSQQFGTLSSTLQTSAGVVTTISNTVFNGTTVKDLAGDANFAQGRWVVGTVTNSSGANVLTGTNNAAYHYLTYNSLAALPTSGSPKCDTGTFTAPTYQGGAATSTPAVTGTTTGNAVLSFSPAGAAVVGSLTSNVNGSAGSVSINSTISQSGGAGIAGALGGGTGAVFSVGANGVSGYLIAIGYTVNLANGMRYTGVANFRCK